MKFKKCFKKVIAAFLALSMCAATGVFAKGGSSDGNEYLKGVIEVLRTFEIIPDYYDYNVNVNEAALRADVASSLAKIAKWEPAETGGIYYYDVPETHWAYDEICALTERKIVCGSEDKLFKPDEKITKAEAYKMAVSVLGYGSYAQAKGGFPTGYMMAAQQIGLTRGLSSGADLNLKDMLVLMYNTMTAEVYRPTVFTDSTAYYEVCEGETLLSESRDIYYNKGVVTGANCITVDGEAYSGAERVKIGDVFYTTDENMEDCLGEEIKLFYHYDEQNEKKELLWYQKTGVTDVLNVAVDNDAAFDSSSFRLKYTDENGREKSVSLSRGIMVILNGGVSSKKLSDLFGASHYNAKFVKNSKGEYSFAVIKAYENVVVDRIDSQNLTVYDKIAPQKKVSLDKDAYKKMSLKMKNASDMLFSDIKEGYVLSVYMSEDGEYLEVQVNAEQAAGDIESVTSVTGGYDINIGGTTYFMRESAVNAPFSAGDSVTAYLDCSDEIAYLKAQNKSYFAAYLLKCFTDEFENTATFRLLKQDGEIADYETVSKLTVDGKRIDAAKCLNYFKADGAFKQQIALIKLNSSEKIVSVDTAEYDAQNESETSLQVSQPYKTNLRYRSSGVLGYMSIINSDTIIFSVPADSEIADADYKDYEVLAKSELKDDKDDYNAETYKTKEKVGFEEYVVLKGYVRNQYSENELPVLVESLSNVSDGDGGVREAITGYVGKTLLTLMADEDVSFSKEGVEEGMLVRIVKDKKTNVVKDFKILYDEKHPENCEIYTDINNWYRVAHGWTNDFVDGVVKIGYNSPAEVDQVMLERADGAPVLIYQPSARKKITIGSLADAVTYQNEPNNATRIVMLTKYTWPLLYVLYK